MKGFNTSIIKPKKFEGAKKAPSSSFLSAMKMEELEPKEKLETSESAESYEVPSADKMPSKGFEGAKKLISPEFTSSLDLKMLEAKKPKEGKIQYMKEGEPSSEKELMMDERKNNRKKYLEILTKKASKLMP